MREAGNAPYTRRCQPRDTPPYQRSLPQLTSVIGALLIPERTHTKTKTHTQPMWIVDSKSFIYTFSPDIFFFFYFFCQGINQFFTPAIILLLKCMRIRYFFYYYYKIGYYSGRSCMVFQTVGTIQTRWISSVSRFTDHFLHRLSLSKEM